MKTSIRILLTGALLGLPVDAVAQDQCKDAYQVGKDIARLEAEVRELRGLLETVLARQVGIAGIEPTPSGETVEPTVVAPAPKKKTTKGTIRGRVTGTKGDAFVYLQDIRGRLVRNKVEDVTQQSRQFKPRWLVIQQGTTVRFPNQDNIYHNVFSNSPYASFDLGIYRRGDDSKSFRFMRPGLVDVFCNMHAKMTAEILVVPNRHYAKVAKDGRFDLDRVPAGRHLVVAWGPGQQPSESWIDVPAGGVAKVDLKLTARNQTQHLNKDGKPYGSY